MVFKGNFNNEIFLPFLNFRTKNNSANINAVLDTKKNKIYIKKLNLEENKNKIDIVNLLLENNILVNFDKISVKTFSDEKFNNNFVVTFDKKIKITGSKYDASNLTKFLEKDGNSSFLKNVNKEISINIKEISSILGGQGGGGRKDLAQAGGKDLNKIKAALDFIKNKILDLG